MQLLSHLHELVCQLPAQLLDDHHNLGPVPPHQQVLLCAGVRKAEAASACGKDRQRALLLRGASWAAQLQPSTACTCPLCCTFGCQLERCLGCACCAAAARACRAHAGSCTPVTSSLEQLLPSVLNKNKLLFCGQLEDLWFWGVKGRGEGKTGQEGCSINTHQSTHGLQ